MSSKVRAAVVGVGGMGHHHARVYSTLPEVELVAVVDTNETTMSTVATYHSTAGFIDYVEMLEQVSPDVVTVAVPTRQHYRVATAALEAGCHVLVEKPIAYTLQEGRRMITSAREVDKILAVGHIERFNPVVAELKRRLGPSATSYIWQMHSRRLGPFPYHVKDAGVILDLATHDLDVMRYLADVEPVRIYAEIRRRIHAQYEDACTGLVTFENYILGVLELSWLSPIKVRELHVTTSRGLFIANYWTQELDFYERGQAVVHCLVQKREPLLVELEAFVNTVRGEEANIVSGEDGLIALRWALRMLESGQRHQAASTDGGRRDFTRLSRS